MKKGYFIIVLSLFLFSNLVFSQNDTIFAPDFRRNTIKWNTTPFLLWSTKNIDISYERILKPYRSFSVNEESEYLKAIHDILIAKYPNLDNFIKEGTFTNSGFSKNLGYGMRYMIQLGFRF